METNQLNITYPAKDVEKSINDYFGTVKHEVKVSMSGRIAIVNLSYQNFKPTRIVRRELEDLIPNLEIMDMDRTYSDDKYMEMLDELSMKETIIYVKESDGNLRATSPALLLEEEMYYRTY